MWETVFEELPKKEMNVPVSIIINGNERKGILTGWTPPDIDNREIVLTYCTYIEELCNDGVLSNIEKQYVDIENDIIVSFYKLDKYNKLS